MTYFLLIITGLIIGIFAPVFGVGGGILVVPALHTLFDGLPAQTVIGCSLFMICINSIVNTWNFKRSNVTIRLDLAMAISFSMAIGIVSGGKVGLLLDGRTIKIFFASMALLLAIKLIFFKKKNNSELPEVFNKSFWIKAIATGLFAGIVSGLTGLGGGAVLVPLMISLLALPLGLISPYSQVSMAIGTFFGSLTYLTGDTPTLPSHLAQIQNFQFGHVNLAIGFSLVIGAMLTSKFGVKLSKNIPPQLAQRLFAGLLTIISAKIFYQQFF